jgi:hypothetical protein
MISVSMTSLLYKPFEVFLVAESFVCVFDGAFPKSEKLSAVRFRSPASTASAHLSDFFRSCTPRSQYLYAAIMQLCSWPLDSAVDCHPCRLPAYPNLRTTDQVAGWAA